MKIRKILATLLMLPFLYACQSESEQLAEDNQEIVQPQRTIKVKASLPDSNGTRAQVKYGTGKEQIGENFMWIYNDDYKDWITIYNITKLVDNPPEGVELEITKFLSDDRKHAEFESVESVNSTYKVEEGDVILAMTGPLRRYEEGGVEGLENVLTYDVGTQANYPQIIVKNPNDESLSYMKFNFKMYDIVRAGEGGQIPDLHFKHLSALMRVTLRNETGEAIYPTQLEFKYPGTESFFNSTLYFSVNDDMSLNVYDDGEIFNGSDVYADNISTTINTKNGTDDAGESILHGESYELYISTVPRIGNKSKGEKFTICLIHSHETDDPKAPDDKPKNSYSITFDKFNTVIEAGKRYWFDLTAVGTEKGERKLMLTSEWKKLQNEQGTTTPEGEQ